MINPTVKFLKFAVLMVAAAFFVGCGNASKTDEQYVQDAQALYEEKDVKAAVIELKNALQQNPDNAEARALLGRIYAVTGAGEAAEKELTKARELGLPLRDIAIPLGESLLLQNKSDQLIERFQKGTYDSDELKAIKSVLIGEAFIQKKLYNGAGKYFDEALQNNLTKPRALLGKALIALVKGDVSKAETLVNEAVELAEESPKTWMTVADVYLAKNDSERVLAAYQKVVDHVHTKQDYYYWIAMRGIFREQLKIGDTNKAEQTLSTLEKTFPVKQIAADLVLTHLRAILAYQQGNYETAAELANRVLSVQKSHLGALLILGTTDAVAGRFQKAESSLSRFLAQRPGHLQARKMLAFVQAQNRQPAEAMQTLDPLVKGDVKPDVETLALIARAAIQAGEVNESSKYLKRALEQNPDNTSLRFALVQSLLAQQNFDMAVQELNKMGGSKDLDVQVKLSTAETYIKAREYKAALEVLEELQKLVPESAMPVSLQGTVYQLMGENGQARAKLITALTIEPGYTPAIRSLAALAIQAGQPDEAESVYEEALAAKPEAADIWFDYAQFLLRQERFDEAEEAMQHLKSFEQYQAQSAVMLARLYLKQGKKGFAISELKNVRNNSNSAIYAELGNAYMDQGEFNSALISYQKLAELESGSATAQYLIGMAYLALNDVESASESFARSLKLDSNFLPALISVAEIALAQNDPVAANKTLNQINMIDPDNPRVVLLNAKLAVQNYNPQRAAELYEQLYDSNQSPELLKGWVQALWQANKKDEAIALLDKEAKDKPNSGYALFLKATILEALGSESKAVELYQKVISLEPDNVAALNNLAWLLKDKAPDAALKYARRAYELAPDNEAVEDTLKKVQGLIK